VEPFLNVFLEISHPLIPPVMIRAGARLNLALLMVLANGPQLIALQFSHLPSVLILFVILPLDARGKVSLQTSVMMAIIVLWSSVTIYVDVFTPTLHATTTTHVLTTSATGSTDANSFLRFAIYPTHLAEFHSATPPLVNANSVKSRAHSFSLKMSLSERQSVVLL